MPGGFPGLLVGLLALIAAAWAAVTWYLRPRTVSAVWKRTSFLSGLAWGGLLLVAESVWPSVASHFAYNVLAWRHMRRQAAGRGRP